MPKKIVILNDMTFPKGTRVEIHAYSVDSPAIPGAEMQADGFDYQMVFKLNIGEMIIHCGSNTIESIRGELLRQLIGEFNPYSGEEQCQTP